MDVLGKNSIPHINQFHKRTNLFAHLTNPPRVKKLPKIYPPLSNRTYTSPVAARRGGEPVVRFASCDRRFAQPE
ncbi:hypothetical protein FHS83_002876 [Rhizomicrobium palustre]|uniref:Uncharacterized protein n=1 Tax=Rhizomicrobium palustre TaxID=189966 RepID=A0A846N0W7_9PROT|nr:hypothetical protein [Rhizomicrobium palustre]